MCVCVYVRERETDIERQRETEREISSRIQNTINMCKISLPMLLEDTGKLGYVFSSTNIQVYLTISHGPQIWSVCQNVSQNVNQIKNCLLKACCAPGHVEALGVETGGWR